MSRLKWFMVGRLVLITGLLSICPLALDLATPPFFFVIGILYFATLIYSLFLKSGIPIKVQAYGQFLVDACIVTLVLFLTGGIESGLVLLYVLSIISASIVVGSGAGIVMAVSCSFLYALLGIFGCLGLLPERLGVMGLLHSDSVYVAYLILVRSTIFFVLGFLGDFLAKGLLKKRLELDRYRKLNEKILMQMKSGLITTGDDGRIIYVNSAAEKILGYKGEQMAGRNWSQFLGSPVEDIDIDWLSERAKSFTRSEMEVSHRDGTTIPIGFTVSSIVDEEGRLLGLLILFRDLTQIRRMEENMKRTDRLSVAGALLASIAHEVRNPLASIRGAVEMLKDAGSRPGQGEKLMNVIIKESDRLDGIISDFLLSGDGTKAVRTSEDLGGLVEDVIALTRERGKVKQGVRLSLERGDGPLYVDVDSSQIKQVYVNILDNALDALHDGGTVTVKIEKVISSIDGGEMARIKFTDDGEGMDAEKMSLFFEPFYSTKEEGTGMGLFVAEQIIRSHGGRLEAESREGGGTIISITLPCSARAR